MRTLLAALAALLLTLATVAPADAVTAWSRGADSNAFTVGTGGAIVTWDDGAGTQSLTVYRATGTAAAPGTWKAYGPLVATETCDTLDNCAARVVEPGVYKLSAGGATLSDAQASVGGR